MSTTLAELKIRFMLGVWLPVPNGFDLLDDNGNHNSHVPNSELEALHPMLPAAVRQLCTKEQVSSFRVTKLLQVLKCAVHLQTTNGEMTAVKNIHNIKVLDSSVSFSAKGYCYHSFADEPGAELCIVPDGDAPTKFAVSREWLDAKYPGWFERFLTATALDCSVADIFENMFSQPSVLSAAALPSDLSP